MIVTKLQGGLGNQLFQWAVSKSLSNKYNTDIYFETSYFIGISSGPVTKWELDIDKLNIDVNTSMGNTLDKKLSIVNDNFHFQEIENDSFLDGYWQSERYFKDIEPEIRELLKMPIETKEYILEKYPILNSNTVSMHIRRGDYINLQNYHPLQTLEYYEKAYNILNESNINVIIFSNDIEWCKSNLFFENMTFIENETNITDLYIMSLCKHNIIANSSFSWWGAWLNENKDKKVIAPTIWFGNSSNLYDGDIIPEKWIRI